MASFRSSRFRAPIFISVAFFLVAALLKIQHWPIANWFGVVAFGLVALVYTVWFFSKKKKWSNDVVKWLAVVVHLAVTYPCLISALATCFGMVGIVGGGGAVCGRLYTVLFVVSQTAAAIEVRMGF